MNLEPGDILVDISEKKDLWHIIERWALGSPYTHVRMFYGALPKAGTPKPVFYESKGRGVIFTSAAESYGQKMVVMRLRESYQALVPDILGKAWEIATDERSFYDYLSVPGFILPRLIFEKLHLPLPLKYHRNPYMICSEAVAEPFWRVNLELVPRDVEPLPGDFATATEHLSYMGTIILSAENFNVNHLG